MIFHRVSPISPFDLFLPLSPPLGTTVTNNLIPIVPVKPGAYFYVCVVQSWNSLPADAVMSAFLNFFHQKGLSAHLDDILYDSYEYVCP